MTYDDELGAMRVLHDTLKRFPREVRDRIQRNVNAALDREKTTRLPIVEHVEATLPEEPC